MTKKHFYFAYGMNTDPQAMYQRTGDSLAIGRAKLPGWRFRFAYYADVVEDAAAAADGVLWELTDQGLDNLDIREGYPYYYNRRMVEVQCQGQVYQAWVYYMRDGEPLALPSDSYLEMLHRGYSGFHVPQHQIRRALAEAKGTPLWPESYLQRSRTARADSRSWEEAGPPSSTDYVQEDWARLIRDI